VELTELNLGIGIAGLGLLVAVLTWLSKARSLSVRQKEIEALKDHLQTYMSIQARGNEALSKEVEKLRKENENLRITVATLSNKPGRAELKLLHTWDRALKVMILRSPGFATAWETAIAEAKQEVEDTDTGVKALARRVMTLLPQDFNSASN
jgi:hypothetical protein